MQSDPLNRRKCPFFMSWVFFGKEILSMIAIPREMNTIDYILDEIGIHQGFCQIMADILKPIPIVMYILNNFESHNTNLSNSNNQK